MLGDLELLFQEQLTALVEDAVEKYDAYFPGHNPIPMKKVINGYVKSVEGKGTGEIIRMYDNC